METLSGLGISASAVTALSKNALAELTDNPEKEVPHLGWYEHTNHEAVMAQSEAPKREPVFYTIPRDEWRGTKGLHKAAHKVGNKFNDERIKTAVSNQQTSYGLSVLVKYEIFINSDGQKDTPDIPFHEVKNRAPDSVSVKLEEGNKTTSVEDIPVFVEKREVSEETQRSCDEETPDGCYYSDVYRPIPGGCEGVDYGVGGCDCTLGTTAYSYEEYEYITTTAAHCINRSSGSSVYQNSKDTDNYIGYSTSNYTERGDGDAAEIKVTESYPTHSIAGKHSDYAWEIGGTVAKDRVEDMAYNGTEIYVQGRRTGRHYEPVAEHDTDRSDPAVGVLASTDGGDSGSPYFEVRSDDKAYIVGLHAWGECYGDIKGAKGNTMYYLEDHLNWSV